MHFQNQHIKLKIDNILLEEDKNEEKKEVKETKEKKVKKVVKKVSKKVPKEVPKESSEEKVEEPVKKKKKIIKKKKVNNEEKMEKIILNFNSNERIDFDLKTNKWNPYIVGSSSVNPNLKKSKTVHNKDDIERIQNEIEEKNKKWN